MSLTILKNKSRRYQATVSGRDKGGFSIVGGRRNQGWVGQDNLGRHLIRTPFRGNEPIGYGGNNEKYVRSIVCNSRLCGTNDPSIIKRSTMNSAGLLLTLVKHPTVIFHADCNNGRCRGDWVKDFEPLNHSQSGYIKRVKISTACDDIDKCSGEKEDDILKPVNCECLVKSSFISGKKKYVAQNTKDKKVEGAVSMGEYIDMGLMKKNDLPTPANKKAFPMTLNHIGCDTNYMTPEEAIRDGELPEDWMQQETRVDIFDIDNPTMLVHNLQQRKTKKTPNVFSDDLVDFGAFEHFITFENDNNDNRDFLYQNSIEHLIPEDWHKNTADTDVVYSRNPYL